MSLRSLQSPSPAKLLDICTLLLTNLQTSFKFHVFFHLYLLYVPGSKTRCHLDHFLNASFLAFKPALSVLTGDRLNDMSCSDRDRSHHWPLLPGAPPSPCPPGKGKSSQSIPQTHSEMAQCFLHLQGTIWER